MDDKYKFDELTRQMVMAAVRGSSAPGPVAAKIATETIVAGLKGVRAAGGPQSPAESVRLITQGMLAGLLLADADFVEACMELLRHLADAAQRASIDPMDMLTWCLEGIAARTPFLPANRVQALESEIDRELMGAGMVFSGLCRKAREEARR